jgi:uncharacterized protein (TIGR03083 family)
MTAVRDAVLTELDAIVTTVRKLSDDELALPSGCCGWSVLDVVTHVAPVVEAQQQAFANMLAGSTETPPYVDVVFDSPAAARDALDAAHQRAVDTYTSVTDADADTLVPLPFGTFPAATALDIVLLEYGTHRFDVARALDADATLSPDAAAAILRLLPAFIAFFAVTPAPDGAAYRLQSPAGVIDVSARDGGWVLEPGDDPTTIRGGDDAVALFALGRIGADDARLDVRGGDNANAAAAEFKTWFPGP